MISLQAHAKVNFTLEVLGRREDGYHEIVSIVQTVGLHDTLTFEPDDDITLECDRPELVSPNNLAFKAAHLLKENANFDRGAHITIRKKIPLAAGLGGGSSDAAATLKGLNRLWETELSANELVTLAEGIGSDVPFFLHGGTALVQGRGERIRPLPPVKLMWMVILSPPIYLTNKTASLYAGLSASRYTRGNLTRKLAARIGGGSNVPPQFLFNVFDEIAFQAFPPLETYWDAFYSLGAREIHVAGSGPSLFSPVARKEQGTALKLMLVQRHGWEAHLVSSWQPPKDEAT